MSLPEARLSFPSHPPASRGSSARPTPSRILRGSAGTQDCLTRISRLFARVWQQLVDFFQSFMTTLNADPQTPLARRTTAVSTPRRSPTPPPPSTGVAPSSDVGASPAPGIPFFGMPPGYTSIHPLSSPSYEPPRPPPPYAGPMVTPLPQPVADFLRADGVAQSTFAPPPSTFPPPPSRWDSSIAAPINRAEPASFSPPPLQWESVPSDVTPITVYRPSDDQDSEYRAEVIALFQDESFNTPALQIRDIVASDAFLSFGAEQSPPCGHFLSNRFESDIILLITPPDGSLMRFRFRSSAVAFQAMKLYPNIEIMRRFESLNAHQASSLASTYTQQWTGQQQQSWRRRQVNVMLDILRSKFYRTPRLRTLLLQTGTAYLVEHREDRFWSDGIDGHGENQMGRLLMQVRGELGGGSIPPIPDSYRRWCAPAAV